MFRAVQPRHAMPPACVAVRLAKVAFQQGGGTFLDVLDAQRRAHEASSALARAQGQRLADAVRLFAAVGADWRGADG